MKCLHTPQIPRSIALGMDAAKKMLEDRQGLMTTLFASLEAMQKRLGMSCQFTSINVHSSWSHFLKI